MREATRPVWWQRLGDWLHPITYRELREVLESRGFAISFSLLHLAMMLASLFQLLIPDNDGDFANTFWVLSAIMLFAVIPFHGLSALSKEREDGRLELLVMSGLTARGVMLGKWFTLMIQSALVLTSLAPYLVVRYYHGGVDPLQDLELLGVMWLWSGALTGIAVGFSASAKRGFRSVALVVAIIAIPNFLGMFLFAGGMSGGTLMTDGIWMHLLMFAVVVYPMVRLAQEVFLLSILSPAENNETHIRLLAILLVAVMAMMGDRAGVELVSLVWVAILATMVVSIRKYPTRLASHYLPLLRFGEGGKLAGRIVLYPGMTTGVICSLLLIFGFFFSVQQTSMAADVREFFSLGIIFIPAAIFQLAAIALLINRKYPGAGKTAAIITGAISVLFMIGFGFIEAMENSPLLTQDTAEMWHATQMIFPANAFILSLLSSTNEAMQIIFMVAAFVIGGFSALYLFVIGNQFSKQAREGEQRAISHRVAKKEQKRVQDREAVTS